MMQKTIKYIGYYDIQENANEKRIFSLAAKTKMDYIIHSLNQNGLCIDIVSMAQSFEKKYYPAKKTSLNRGNNLILFPSFPTANIITKFIKHISPNINLFLYLVMNVKKNETIMVYHSLGYRNTMAIAKRIVGFKIVLEVEEIYQDIVHCSNALRKKENESITKADKYIFSTGLLNERINIECKPFIILYGTYYAEKKYDERFDDQKTHIVYAGSFDSRKGGVDSAISVSKYLDDKYHVHIAGFGSSNEKLRVLQMIDDVSMQTNCLISFEGALHGEKYSKLLQKCHIGLSTQNPIGEYNNSSFPSKVLSYMANGLRVVSTRIKVLETSEINDLIYYYDQNCPEDIAEVVKHINLEDVYDSRARLKKLDTKFTNDIQTLLSEVSK